MKDAKAARRGRSRDSDSRATHPRRIILVVGMHRSGTSATAKVLSLLGGVLPQHVTPADDYTNVAGFWEPENIVSIHDELLKSVGSVWHDTSPLSDEWFDSDAARVYASRLKVSFLEEYGDSDLAVVKDPRICRLLPLWIALVESLPATPLFVLTYRHPLEVAASLQKRDGFPPQKSLLLWLQHVVLAERETRGRPRAFVSFASLLANPGRVIEELSKKLGVRWPRATSEAIADIESFLTTDLRNHVVETMEIPQDRSGLLAQTHRLVGGLRGELSRQAVKELDAVHRSYAASSRLMGPLVNVLEKELAEKTDTARTLRETEDSLTGTIDARDRELESVKGVLRAREEELGSIKPVLRARGEELETIKPVLRAREEELETIKPVLRAREEELETIKPVLRAREEELETIKPVLRAREEELESIKPVLRAREEELETIKPVLRAREEELESIKPVLRAREEELESIKLVLRAQEKEIGSLKSLLRAYKASIPGRVFTLLQRLQRKSPNPAGE